MTREEYIESAVSAINDKRIKAEVRDEISAHLDDRIDYYLNAGYDYEYALNHAIERMGDTAKYTEDLSKLHNDGNTLVSLYVNLIIGVLFMVTNFIINTTGINMYDMCVVELWAAFSVFTALSEGLKRRKVSLHYVALAFQSLFVVFKISGIAKTGVAVALTSNTLLLASEVITGNMDAAKALVNIGLDYLPPIWIVVLSVAVYIGVYALLIVAIFHIRKTSAKHHSLKQKQFEERFVFVIKGICYSAIFFTVINLIAGTYALISNINKDNRDLIVVVESDTVCDFTDIVDEDLSDVYFTNENTNENPNENIELSKNGKTVWLSFIDFDKDYNSLYDYYYPATDNLGVLDKTASRMETEKLGIINYKVNHNRVKYTPKHKYVYVISMATFEEYNSSDYNENKWELTNKEHQYSFEVEQSKYPSTINHLIISKKAS